MNRENDWTEEGLTERPQARKPRRPRWAAGERRMTWWSWVGNGWQRATSTPSNSSRAAASNSFTGSSTRRRPARGKFRFFQSGKHLELLVELDCFVLSGLYQMGNHVKLLESEDASFFCHLLAVSCREPFTRLRRVLQPAGFAKWLEKLT